MYPTKFEPYITSNAQAHFYLEAGASYHTESVAMID